MAFVRQVGDRGARVEDKRTSQGATDVSYNCGGKKSLCILLSYHIIQLMSRTQFYGIIVNCSFIVHICHICHAIYSFLMKHAH